MVVEFAEDLVCGYHLALLRPKLGKLDGRFLLRCLQAKMIRVYLELASNGVTRFGIPKYDIGKMPLPLPPFAEQQKIADYVERETGRMDDLVSGKERLLKLLDEKRRAFIIQIVTHGLNPRTRMKNSGHEWLGEVPAHWDVKRTKRVFSERDDRSETGEEEMLTVSHITGVTKRSEKDVNMFEAETNEGYKICSPGNLVINTLWAWMGAMGISPEEGIVSPAYHVYELADEILPGYVDALVRTPAFIKEVTRFSTGVWSSRLRLYPEGLFEVRIPVPPLDEQKAIGAAIERERARTTEFETALRQSIALLKERRAALITAAVTGQIPITEMTK
jgi:type I restriction enzyme S subunit